jgi:hypothetical protein
VAGGRYQHAQQVTAVCDHRPALLDVKQALHEMLNNVNGVRK